MEEHAKAKLKARLLLLVEGYNDTDNEVFLVEIREACLEIMEYEEKDCEEAQESEYYPVAEETMGILQTDYSS